MLRRMQIFAFGIFSRTSTFDTVVASRHPSVLNFDVRRRVGEFALQIGARTLAPLEFAANLQLQPPRIFDVQNAADQAVGRRRGRQVSRSGGRRRPGRHDAAGGHGRGCFVAVHDFLLLLRVEKLISGIISLVYFRLRSAKREETF